MVRLVGAGKMTHHQRELEAAPQVRRAGRAVNPRSGKPKSVHAAIDMDGSRELGARGLGEGCPFFDFFGAVEYGAQAQLAIDRTRILEQAIQDVDGGVGKKRAQLLGFAKRGNEESLAACMRERRRNLGHAEPIGIGLDHRGAFGWRAEVVQGAVVGDDSSQDRW